MGRHSKWCVNYYKIRFIYDTVQFKSVVKRFAFLVLYSYFICCLDFGNTL